MAIEKVSKVAVAVHRDQKDDFLPRLQHLGILHIVKTVETDGATGGREGDKTLNQLLTAIESLAAFAGKTGTRRVVVSRAEYEKVAQNYDPTPHLKQIELLVTKKKELENQARLIAEEINRLRPWVRFPYSSQELKALAKVKVILGRLPSRMEFNGASAALEEKAAALQEVTEEGGMIFAAAIIAADAVDEILGFLAMWRWETVELKLTASPAETLKKLEQECSEITTEIERIQQQIADFTRELPRFKMKADFLLNQGKRDEVETLVEQTDSVLLIYGWIKNRDINKLERLIEQTGSAAFIKIQPEPNEQPPVALTNKRLWRPFELVLELYQLPLPNEMDPTWLIAPFFGIFFALCLTDAGYGIVVAVIAFLLMRRIGMNNKLLGIVFIGALLTIPAGAMVGGWFGDIPDRLGVKWLVAMKQRFLWFDPMQEPMKFFILSVGLGYLQLIAGIAFEIADCLRNKNYGDGLLGQLPWFILLNSLMARFVFARYLSETANALLLVFLLASVAAIVVFTRREKEVFVFQWLWFCILAAGLVFFASRQNWLPGAFGYSKWLVLGFTGTLILWTGYTIFQKKYRTGLRIVIGILSIIGLGFYLFHILPFWVPFTFAVLFSFLAPGGIQLLKKFVWGGYALYGATSYIGVLLSYIRLMALGMCTGGVAMAINVIAWMVGRMPFVGIFLALIVLVIGHSYNIAVNVLGAFVHSLRLQYVEFFPRFYTGGGEPFTPFREERRFVILQS